MLCPLCKTNCGTKKAEDFPNNLYAMQFMKLVNQKHEEMQVTLIKLDTTKQYYTKPKIQFFPIFFSLKGLKTGA